MHAQGAGSLHEKCRSLWAQWPDPPTPASSSPSRFSELNSSTLNATQPAEHALDRLLAVPQLGQLPVDDAHGRHLPQHCKRAALVIGRAVFKARAVKGRAAKVHMWLLRNAACVAQRRKAGMRRARTGSKTCGPALQAARGWLSERAQAAGRSMHGAHLRRRQPRKCAPRKSQKGSSKAFQRPLSKLPARISRPQVPDFN